MAIGDRLRERRAKRKEKDITPEQEQETNVPVEQKPETLTLSPAIPQENDTSGNDKILTFSEFAGNPEEFMINFAKRNPEPDITEGLNFFKSGNYTVPAEALNYFGKELDEYLKSRNIPEEDRERIKKKIRRTRIADALMKTANIIGQTVAVAKGGTPVPINGRPVLQSLKDQTERRQKEWERELEYALQNDKALNTRAYSDYLQRMMDDRKSARDAELKRDIAGQNYDLGIKKLANDVEIEKIRGESRRNAAYINSANRSRGDGSSNKTFEFMVNNNTYRLSDDEAKFIAAAAADVIAETMRKDPKYYTKKGTFNSVLYDSDLKNIYKETVHPLQFIGYYIKKYPHIIENSIITYLRQNRGGTLDKRPNPMQDKNKKPNPMN